MDPKPASRDCFPLDSTRKEVFTEPMSLRILLIDTSASIIQKVFQKSLQDLDTEIRSIPDGAEALQVTESYKPHIIFVDVLLKRKDGYEVSREIHQSFNQIPVILMRSEFVELDQKKYNNCGAKAELEKPFHVKEMRKLVTSLVKEVQSSKISQFLDFPEGIKTDPKQKPLERSNSQRDETYLDEKISPFIQDQTPSTEKPSTSWETYSHDDLSASNEDSTQENTPLDFQPLDLKGDKESDLKEQTPDFQISNTDPKTDEKPELGDIGFQSLDTSLKTDEKPEPDDFLFQLDQTPPTKEDPPNEKEDPESWSTESASNKDSTQEDTPVDFQPMDLQRDKESNLKEQTPDLQISDTDSKTDEKPKPDDFFFQLDQTPPPKEDPPNEKEDQESWSAESASNKDFTQENTPVDFQPMDLQRGKESDPKGQTPDLQISNTDSKTDEKPKLGDEKPELGDLDFQSLDTSSKSDEKPELGDFLFQPDQTPSPKENSPDEKPSPDPPQSSLDKNKMEQIVRMETHSLLQKIVKENLPGIMEKLVREELQKILEQEMTLKKNNTQSKEEI